MAATKIFKLRPEEFRPLVSPMGGCFASDHITVQGLPVGYMYREEPDHGRDRGWRFFSGTESQSYVDDPSNLAIYDVNTIANYDPDIISFLDAPVGSAFERDDQSGAFVEVHDFCRLDEAG